MDYQFLIENLTWPVIILVVGLYFVFNPEKLDFWIALITRGFSYVSRWSERKTVSSEIQSNIHNYVSKYKVKNILPYGLKFKWATGKNFESFVKEGDVFIYMEDHQNTTKNFVKTIVSFTSKGFIPKVRPYVPKKILNASELMIQEKIILDQRSDAIDFFRDEIIPKKEKEENGTSEYRVKFQTMDKNGFFDNIFLIELEKFGSRFKDVFLADSDSDINNFIDLLEQIAQREPGETTTLDYNGKVFRVHVILIATAKKIESSMAPYVARVQKGIANDIDSIYLLARNKKVKYMEPLLEKIKIETKAKIIWKKNLKTIDHAGKLVDTSVCLLRNPSIEE